MSSPRPYEQVLLSHIDAHLSAAASAYGDSAHEARLEILEGVSSRVGGYRLGRYRKLAAFTAFVSEKDALRAADEVLGMLQSVPIHPALALTALARPPLGKSEQKSSGAFYTDFRLAQMLAARLPADPTLTVLDPASGTGILLVALALHTSGVSRHAVTTFIRDSVSAADLSALALRGVALALSSLTDDLSAIAAMLPRLRQMDSLVAGKAAWTDIAPDGFSSIIGNPPWEKLKINRHEFAASNGGGGHYGAQLELSKSAASKLTTQRASLAKYVSQVQRETRMQGSGEPDLYKLFLELGFNLVAPDGHLAYLLPAGLIRSDGTEALRHRLFTSPGTFDITILENRARFFAIDTRFKFVALHTAFSDGDTANIKLSHGTGNPTGVDVSAPVRMNRRTVERVRRDLSIPEVRTPREWALFRKMSRAGRFDSVTAVWQPSIMREVDMSRDRPLFQPRRTAGAIAVAEGRMVHQHRFGAKSYRSGTGRRAVWECMPIGAEAIEPQFWIQSDDLRPAVAERIASPRVGFCDVTGQTNERSLLASRVPAGVVCGNKVPTIVLGGPDASPRLREELNDLWVALANSFAMDWYLRRVLTTTVNYFILLSLPFPDFNTRSLPARRIIQLSRRLQRAQAEGDLWRLGDIRAELDARVFAAFGFSVDDADVVMADFPLLDRGQPALPGQVRSTVTRDLVLAHLGRITGLSTPGPDEAVALSRTAGAYPYVPGEWAGITEDSQAEVESV